MKTLTDDDYLNMDVDYLIYLILGEIV